MKAFKSQQATIGERINLYDTFITQNVGNFNAMFPECPIKGYDVEDPVSIAEPAPGDSRVIFIDGEPIVHKMYSDILYNVERELAMKKEDEGLSELEGHTIYE